MDLQAKITKTLEDWLLDFSEEATPEKATREIMSLMSQIIKDSPNDMELGAKMRANFKDYL